MHSKEKSYAFVLFASASLLLIVGLFFPPASIQNVDESNNLQAYTYGYRWYTELKMGQKIEFSYEADTPVKLWIFYHQMPVTEMSSNWPSNAQFILDEPATSYSYAFTAPSDNVYSFIFTTGENTPINIPAKVAINAKATVSTPYVIHMVSAGLSLLALGILALQRRVTDWTRHFNTSLKLSLILLTILAYASAINLSVGFSFLFVGYETIIEALTLSSLTFTATIFLLEFMSRREAAEKFAAIKKARTREIVFRIIPFICLNITFMTILPPLLASALIYPRFPQNLLYTTAYREVNEIVLTSLGFFLGLSGIITGNLYLLRALRVGSEEDYSGLRKWALSTHFTLGVALLILAVSPFNTYMQYTLQNFIYGYHGTPIAWLMLSALETGVIGYAMMKSKVWNKYSGQKYRPFKLTRY